MIIGNGMMAKQFAKYKHNKDVLIFASGVSNSKEVLYSEFDREASLLKSTIELYPDTHFVYFGTSSMYDPMARNSPYVLHKLAMEQYVVENCKSYNIFRISQVIGRANNSTLVNYLVNNILHDKEFDVWGRATRNLIAVEDVFKIIDYILSNNLLKNKIINVANAHNISIVDFVHVVENVLSKQSRMHVVQKGAPFDKIDIKMIDPLLNKLDIKFTANYYISALNNMLLEELV